MPYQAEEEVHVCRVEPDLLPVQVEPPVDNVVQERRHGGCEFLAEQEAMFVEPVDARLEIQRQGFLLLLNLLHPQRGFCCGSGCGCCRHLVCMLRGHRSRYGMLGG